MFRVRAVHALYLGVLMAAVGQAQQPMPPGMTPGPMLMAPAGGPMMDGPAGPMMGPPMVAPAMFQDDGYGPGAVQPASCFGGGCGGDCMGGCGDCMGGCGDCMGGCGDFMGGGCGGCCPPPGCPVVFNGEVESSFLFLNIDGTEALGSFDAPALPVGAVFVSNDAELENELTVIPRVWLHAQKCEWGVGARLWYLSESSARLTPLNLLALNIIGDYTMERVEALNGDVELTYSWHRASSQNYGLFRNSSIQIGVGGRYTEFQNDSLILANAALGDAIAHASSVARSEFDGTGITSGARGTVLLRRNVSLFWSARGSFIWGDLTTQSQSAATALAEPDVAAGQINSAGTISNEELFIGEAQVGIEWEHNLQCVPATCFFRVAGEYQYWDVNSAAISTTDATADIVILPAGDAVSAYAESTAEAPRVEMYGVSIAAGLTW